MENRSLGLYKLTGKYIQGYNLIALEITGENGEKKLLKIDDIYKLVEKGLIYGCKLVENNGEVHLLSTEVKIASLPLVTNKTLNIKLTGRVYNANELVGYTAVDNNNHILNLSKDKVWELSKNGNIINAKAHISNNKKILSGVGEYLRDLPLIKI